MRPRRCAARRPATRSGEYTEYMADMDASATIHDNTRTPHTVCWSMLSKARAATHLYHVCACGFDTSKRYINTFINTCAFMYQGSGGDSHQWAALVLPVSIHTHTAASGEGTQTGHVSICIVQYRETSIQPHVLNTEHMKAPSMQADTLPIPDHAPTKYIAIQDVGTPQIQRMYCR